MFPERKHWALIDDTGGVFVETLPAARRIAGTSFTIQFTSADDASSTVARVIIDAQ